MQVLILGVDIGTAKEIICGEGDIIRREIICGEGDIICRHFMPNDDFLKYFTVSDEQKILSDKNTIFENVNIDYFNGIISFEWIDSDNNRNWHETEIDEDFLNDIIKNI